MAYLATNTTETLTDAVATLGQRPRWKDIAGRYLEERECIASFIALECAEVIAGEKPATLISVANKRRSCGRNLYLLWQRYGAAVLADSVLQAEVLTDRGGSVLLMFYRPEAMAALLMRRSVSAVLAKVGYPKTDDPKRALSVLKSRVAGCQDGFPHEIGVFLGYPLKDVVGFMGWGRAAFTCQGPWKIFGDPTESLRLAAVHRACRCTMSSALSSGCDPLMCLRATGAVKSLAPAALTV